MRLPEKTQRCFCPPPIYLHRRPRDGNDRFILAFFFQMKAPWRALQTHNYDDTLNLSLPPDVCDPPLGKAITAGGLCDQVMLLLVVVVRIGRGGAGITLGGQWW